jgi:hypothetical protein
VFSSFYSPNFGYINISKPSPDSILACRR